MLDDQAYNHIVSWGDNGTSFVVKDQNEFSREILPKHFKHCNFASFVRQLNKYDFHKVKNSDETKLSGEQV
jgi:osomolarity two-component system response regulator SKN7